MTKVLVVGAGSIGRRHLANLLALGHRDVALVDADPERLRGALPDERIRRSTDYEAALREFAPDAVLVCTPPVLHVAQARAASAAGADCFIEKPLGHALDGAAELAREARSAGRLVQIGYNLRFHPAVAEIRSLVSAGAIGRLFWARAEFGQYLPEWRPWQDYRQGYTARRALGGGILLDGSHELDLVISFLGRPVDVRCFASTVGALEVDVEDSASLMLRFEGDVHADVHVDLLQRAYTRSLKLAGTDGTIVWDYGSGEVRTYRAATGRWDVTAYPADPDLMYRAEIERFIACTRTRSAPPVDLAAGVLVLAVVLAAKTSASSGGVPVRIPDA